MPARKTPRKTAFKGGTKAIDKATGKTAGKADAKSTARTAAKTAPTSTGSKMEVTLHTASDDIVIAWPVGARLKELQRQVMEWSHIVRNQTPMDTLRSKRRSAIGASQGISAVSGHCRTAATDAGHQSTRHGGNSVYRRRYRVGIANSSVGISADGGHKRVAHRIAGRVTVVATRGDDTHGRFETVSAVCRRVAESADGPMGL